MKGDEMIHNPVIRGFAPDPSAVRMGDDYYIANSTFEWFPGVRLHHSRDLCTWTEITPPLRRKSQLDMTGDPNSGGIWAPDISVKDGRFYLVYTDVKSKQGIWYNTLNYLVCTDDIRGDWSDPVYLNSSGFDPSLFHDDDGRSWLVNMKNGFGGILIQEFDVKTGQLTGDVCNIYPGSGAGYTEGPHIYKRQGFYYLIVAEGGTGFGHRVTVARAQKISGPYETMPGPLLTSSDDATRSLQKAGHGDLFETASGDWYLCYLCARPVPGHLKCVLGRETAIEKIIWTDDGWPCLVQGGHHPSEASPEAAKPFIDHFDKPFLDVGWKSLRVPIDEDISLTARQGSLRLTGRQSIFSMHHVALLARKQEAFRVRAELSLDYEPLCSEHAAGLVYLYDNAHFYLLVKTRREDGVAVLSLYEYIAMKMLKSCEESVSDGRLMLSVHTDSVKARFAYSTPGTAPKPIGPALEVSPLSDEEARGFTGAHFALYAHDLTGCRHPAFFDSFSVIPE